MQLIGVVVAFVAAALLAQCTWAQSHLDDRFVEAFQATSSLSSQSHEINQYADVLKDLTQLIENVDLKEMLKTLNETNTNIECDLDFIAFLHGLLTGKSWAVSMLDSYGKPGAGITLGNVKWPGMYSMCKAVAPIVDDKTIFHGQYCWLSVGKRQNSSTAPSPAAAQTIQIGLCVPDSCSTQDVTKLLSVLEGFASNLTAALNITIDCLPTEKNFENDTSAIAAVSILIVFLVIVFIGTLYDVCISSSSSDLNCLKAASVNGLKNMTLGKGKVGNSTVALNTSIESIDAVSNFRKNSEGDQASGIPEPPVVHQPSESERGVFPRILLAFSVYTNGKKLFDLTPPKESLSCINGIRFLSMTWVILGHTFMVAAPLNDNLLDVVGELKDFFVQTIIQGTMSVDSFFVMSGLLVTYLFLKENERSNGKISWLKFYLHRYWRLTVAYICVLFLLVPTVNYWGEGPFWTVMDKETCPKYWWQNLLYINNFFPMDHMCMAHTWYLANDMQFYVISPIILILLTKKVSLAALTVGILLLASWISTGLVAYDKNISASIADITNAQQMNDVYTKPYCRIGPYLAGMMCGWLLFKTKCKVTLKAYWVILGWMAAIACNMSVVYGLYDVTLSRGVTALYVALSRTAWGLGLCWVIFACCTGYGGIINKILSWPAWNPFSRVTYCAYLWHLYLIYALFSGREELGHYSRPVMFSYYVGTVAMSYAGAIVISLMFEAPSLALEKILLKR